MNPNANHNRRRRPQRKSNAIANPRVQVRSTPQEVLVRLRLGCSASIPLVFNTTVNSIRVNDPFAMVDNFSVRANDFVSYRILGMKLFLCPNSSVTTVSGSSTTQWGSAVLTSALNSLTPPSSLNQLMELPQAQLRPTDLGNPLSRRIVHWKASDVNALAYTNRGLAPELTTVTCYASWTRTTSLPNWEILITGWMDVEFKGLAVF